MRNVPIKSPTSTQAPVEASVSSAGGTAAPRADGHSIRDARAAAPRLPAASRLAVGRPGSASRPVALIASRIYLQLSEAHGGGGDETLFRRASRPSP